MARCWICEVCGKTNNGDLCPGCATPKPFRVRSHYIANPLTVWWLEDGTATTKGPVQDPWFYIAALIVIVLLVGNISLWPWALAVVVVSLVRFFWRSLLISPRLWLYRLRR